jgi:hypothetical protein
MDYPTKSRTLGALVIFYTLCCGVTRGDVVVTIPNPHRGDIRTALPQRILEQAGISRDEWLSG